jgi:hypothetical protein
VGRLCFLTQGIIVEVAGGNQPATRSIYGFVVVCEYRVELKEVF